MDLRTELWIKGSLCLIGMALVLWRLRRPGKLGSREAGSALVLFSLACAAAYVNFGRFHGAGMVHHWEQFHYVLGSKYFPEVGYDGLYVASMGAQLTSEPDRPRPTYLRDLRNNNVVDTDALSQQGYEVRQRFSDRRWREFVRDHKVFLAANNDQYLAKIRTDHGFNPTPTWTFTARLFSGWGELSDRRLNVLGAVDLGLFAVLFVVIARTYGGLVGCLALIIFGCGYPWRYDWVGGAFLRQDWLIASGIGICMLKRQRFATAGALFGYAAMVRIFPLLLLFGPGVVALRQLLRRERPRWALRLAVGFLLSVAVCFAAGSAVGRGPRAWKEFAQNLEKHRASWLTNNVGLENVLLYGPDTFSRRLVDWSAPEPWFLWQGKMDADRAARRPLILLVQAAFLLMIGAAVWRSPPDEAAVAGVAVVFGLLFLTCYYWVMLLWTPIRGGLRTAAGVLGLSALLYAVHLGVNIFETIYGVMSWALALLFIAWLGPDAWSNLRRPGRATSTASPSGTPSARGGR